MEPIEETREKDQSGTDTNSDDAEAIEKNFTRLLADEHDGSVDDKFHDVSKTIVMMRRDQSLYQSANDQISNTRYNQLNDKMEAINAGMVAQSAQTAHLISLLSLNPSIAANLPPAATYWISNIWNCPTG